MSDLGSGFEFLICSTCGAADLHVDEKNIRCGSCRSEFKIVNGIPRFVPDDDYAQSFGFQWNAYAQTQLDSFTGISISRDRLFETSRWSTELSGQTVLEAGSGAGRFTEALVATGANIISLDLSSAVDANYRSNGHNKNLLILQASLLNIPVLPKSMDKVICLGVLQHTPDPEQCFLNLANCVKAGGEIVVDVYAARLRSLISWKYLLRPITRRMDDQRLYALIEKLAPKILPFSDFLASKFGRFGSRLLPFAHYPSLGLSPEMARQWAILDTFDMYSPAHDHPQSLATVQKWFTKVGFSDVHVGYGLNGVVARGRRPGQLA